MLVIVSDLHFTDGSSGETISEGAFKVFRQRLCDMAYDASWRLKPNAQGESKLKTVYRPIRKLDIVLLGDILDVIRSKRWGSYSKTAVRPWRDHQRPQWAAKFADKVAQITDKILEHNKPSLGVLRSLSRDSVITLPPAKKGEPDPDVAWTPTGPRRKRVTVGIHYMAGNHDWFYHLRGQPYNEIRGRIKEAMGLANDAKRPFPHEPEESRTISRILANHSVYARHGDIYDSFNFERKNGRDASSLGDAIVIDLLNRFPAAVKAQMKKELKGLPPAVVDGLLEIDNVRPLILAPVWIDGLLKRLCRNRKQINQVKEVWNKLVDRFFKIEFVKDRDSPFNPWDNVDMLQAALRLSQGLSFHTAGQLLAWINKKGFKKTDSYWEDALTEPEFTSGTARYIVYGHTHHHEIVPLDVSYSQRGEVKQLYLNSGTWRRVHKLARHKTKDEEFIGHNVMTYLAFYTGDERCGRSFESWSGALDVVPESTGAR